MKKNLLLLLGVAVMFFSCQNDAEQSSIEEEQTLTEAELLAQEAEILVSDGEEDPIFQMNAESEILVQRENNDNNGGLTFSVASESKSAAPAESDLEGLVASLPETVSVNVKSKPGDGAYFTIDLLDTNLADTDVPAWCVDVDLSLGVEGPLDFSVYSSYDVPEGKYENAQNFDLVNYILNQDYVGKESASGGVYTFGHVQWAIWELIDDRNCSACTFLTNPTGAWRNDPNNVVKGQEIVDAALANGDGFVPGVGELLAVVLDPAGKQPIIIGKEVPAKEQECDDCEGDVDELTLKYEWVREKRVSIYQRKENTCWGVKIFDKVLQPGEEFDLEGVNHDGSFGKYVYIYINHCYYTKIKTNCFLNIGPGYERGVFSVVKGTSTHGGELCEYVQPNPHNYCRWWWSTY